MKFNYNNLLNKTGTWQKSPTLPSQYKQIINTNLGGINRFASNDIIEFSNLPAGVTVADAPTRTDPADRALGRCIINLGYPENPLPYGLSFSSFPFQKNLQIFVDRINCISGSRDLYQNYLAPVTIGGIYTYVDYPLYEGVNLDSPYNNTSNISGCIMYEYVNGIMSGSIFLTGNGTGYLNTGYNSFTFSENRGSYIADYTYLTMNFKSGVYVTDQMDTDPTNPGIPSEFLPDEILSSYTKISASGIQLDPNIDKLGLNRLHILFNKP